MTQRDTLAFGVTTLDDQGRHYLADQDGPRTPRSVVDVHGDLLGWDPELVSAGSPRASLAAEPQDLADVAALAVELVVAAPVDRLFTQPSSSPSQIDQPKPAQFPLGHRSPQLCPGAGSTHAR